MCRCSPEEAGARSGGGMIAEEGSMDARSILELTVESGGATPGVFLYEWQIQDLAQVRVKRAQARVREPRRLRPRRKCRDLKRQGAHGHYIRMGRRGRKVVKRSAPDIVARDYQKVKRIVSS